MTLEETQLVINELFVINICELCKSNVLMFGTTVECLAQCVILYFCYLGDYDILWLEYYYQYELCNLVLLICEKVMSKFSNFSVHTAKYSFDSISIFCYIGFFYF